MNKKKRVAISLELHWAHKHHQDVFAGVMDYAHQCGDWDCLIGPFPERYLRGRKNTRYCDAILARVTRPMFAAARAKGIPIVNVWYSSPVLDKVLTVVPDHKKKGRIAAQHLIARGFQRFSYIGTPRRDLGAKDVYEGYAQTLREARLSLVNVQVPARFPVAGWGWDRFHRAMETWMSHQSFPVGILCESDIMARYVSSQLARRGISVPHDVAIVGDGNEELVCTRPDPSLTSLDANYRAVGFRAAELLDGMIDGEAVAPRLIYLPSGDLVPRGSTEALVVEDRMVTAALRFITDRSHEAIRVGDVAAAVHVSRRSLERQFRSALNQSVSRHISLQRVERAKRMLTARRRSSKQIARECGFSSVQQMWSTFKRLTGMTPKAFSQLGMKKSPQSPATTKRTQ